MSKCVVECIIGQRNTNVHFCIVQPEMVDDTCTQNNTKPISIFSQTFNFLAVVIVIAIKIYILYILLQNSRQK